MRSIALALVAALTATTALAGQNDRGPKGRSETQSRGVEVVVRAGGVNLTVQRTIREYYADKPKSARELPPGVARNYAYIDSRVEPATAFPGPGEGNAWRSPEAASVRAHSSWPLRAAARGPIWACPRNIRGSSAAPSD